MLHRLRPSAAHRGQPVLLATALSVALAGFALPGQAAVVGAAEPDAASVPAIFDSATVHEIDVSFDEAEYDAMIAAYRDTGDKEWIEATVTIDGVTYGHTGMRLKGNSSLMSLGGRGPGGGDPGQPGGGEPAGSATADEPERLPWLLRLDRTVEDQEHQGYTDLVVRSNRTATSLNEAVALDLLEQAGLASQDAVATRFSVNGGEPVLRLVIEHPDDTWQERVFGTDGALYKAEATGDFSYRGEDPDAYDEVFDQEAGEDVADLAPLIDFLRFINESDDGTFAAELPDRLDVESFATYLAMMELIDNRDDIDGPGNNAYLRYDPATRRFTVVPWDMNLAFGGMGGGFGGGFGGGDGRRPPTGIGRPTGSPAPDGFGRPDRDLMRPGGGRFERDNALVTRFHANATFEALYEERLAALRATLFSGGAAQEILDRWVGVLSAQATDLVDASTIGAEAAAIAERFGAA
jgi:spore coat protein CotH